MILTVKKSLRKNKINQKDFQIEKSNKEKSW